MAYRKKTLRTMSPTARKVARLVGEQVSVALRLKNLIPDLQRLDLDSRALQTAKAGITLSDTDLWGLRDCLYHCQQDGYLEENKEWGENMVQRINDFRSRNDPPETEIDRRWEKVAEVHAVHDPITGTTTIE